MLKIKVSHINSLTDARYFAAMGVDYLGFCCNSGTEKYCSPAKIKEISDWVQGPEFVLEFDGWQSEANVRDIINNHLGQAVHFGAFSTYSEDFGLPIFKDIFLEDLSETKNLDVDYLVIKSEKQYLQLSVKDKSLINQWCGFNDVFLDIFFEIDDIPTILKELKIKGMILRGGEEEKLGLKSFEELDRIFEMLT
jgi:phosphoribosylanthranilate isomerase